MSTEAERRAPWSHIKNAANADMETGEYHSFSRRPEESQRRRAHNREGSPGLLLANGIEFEAKNEGAHLIVQTARGVVDFWPGTGLWIPRGTNERKRGVRLLILWARGAA